MEADGDDDAPVSVVHIPHYRLDFRLERKIEEQHPTAKWETDEGWVNRANWSVQFCTCLPINYGNYFATVGGNCVTVYHILETNDVKLVQAFPDEDEEEVLYDCAWSSTERDAKASGDGGGDGVRTPVLVVGGKRGVLKAIDLVAPHEVTVMVGHGDAINEIRVHPVDDNLVLTASKDSSIRLWNVRTAVCIAIFASERCHRDQVLTCDPHPSGKLFASGGLDTSVRVWNLLDPIVQNAIQLSYTQPRRPGNLAFATVSVQASLYATTVPHNNYVDCVRWAGNCLLSRDSASTQHRVLLWGPDNKRWEVNTHTHTHRPLPSFATVLRVSTPLSSSFYFCAQGAATMLREFHVPENTDVWWLRACVCPALDIFAIGTIAGNVYIYSIYGEAPARKEPKNKKGAGGSKSNSSSSSSSSSNNNSSGDAAQTVPDAGPEVVGHQCVLRYEDSSKPINGLRPPPATVRAVAFNARGSHLVYCCDNSHVYVWSITKTPVDAS